MQIYEIEISEETQFFAPLRIDIFQQITVIFDAMKYSRF